MMELLITCPFCRKEYSIMVDKTGYFYWHSGIFLAQEAFPDLTPTERECLISHICPECQEMTFSDEFDE